MARKTRKKRKRDAEKPLHDEAASEEAEATPEERIAALEKEVEELRGKWLRAQADYQNLRRRGQLDYETGLQRSLQPLLEELLLVLDFLDMALASPTSTEEAKNLALGVEMTRNKFVQALESAEVRPIPTDGLFDPELHEAADTRDEPDVEPGTVVETLRRGYTWRGGVLRFAKVVVAAGADDEEAPPPDEDEERDVEKEEE